VTSTELDEVLGCEPGATEKLSGVSSRFFAGKDETTSAMGAWAAEAALQAAGIGINEIDCIVAACGVMEQPIPSTSVLIHHKLGLADSGVPAFDVNTTCLSFLTALSVVSALIQSGEYQKVLIVSSDLASTGLDWKEPEASTIFGDGAAAVVVEGITENQGSRILASRLETYSIGKDACVLAAGGTRLSPDEDLDAFMRSIKFQMDGQAAFKLSAQKLPDFLQRILDEAAVTLEDLKLIVPHQASALALDHIRKRLRLPEEKMVNIFASYGNQVASSIPTAFHYAVSNGLLQRGDKCLLLGTAAGISIGGLVMEY
jgi:3-oxoacyl-[acyl-carrier-protein] synthase-3